MSTVTANGDLKRRFTGPTPQDWDHLGAFDAMLDLIRDRTDVKIIRARSEMRHGLLW